MPQLRWSENASRTATLTQEVHDDVPVLNPSYGKLVRRMG